MTVSQLARDSMGGRRSPDATMIYYFAYGSNCNQAIMEKKGVIARTPSARPVGTSLLPGHRLTFHKRGRDGSGKCDAFETAHLHRRLLDPPIGLE